MKIFLLRPLKKWRAEDAPEAGNPWKPWYDRCFGMVVRAKNEAQARALAGGDEWADPEFSSCEELRGPGGAAEVIIKDEHWA